MDEGGKGLEISRRDFLKVVGSATAGFVLTGCGIKSGEEGEQAPQQETLKSYAKREFSNNQEMRSAITDAAKEYLTKFGQHPENASREAESILNKGMFKEWSTIHLMVEIPDDNMVTATNNVDILRKMVDEMGDKQGNLVVFQSFEETQQLLKDYQASGREFLYRQGVAVEGKIEENKMNTEASYGALIKTP